MIFDGEKVALKKTDNYYYQVQAQLNITERNYCYFVVWTPKGKDNNNYCIRRNLESKI